MKGTVVGLLVMVMGIQGLATVTQYQEPLPTGMAQYRTFFDAYTASATGQPDGVPAWYQDTTPWGGYNVQSLSHNNSAGNGWNESYWVINNTWIQWNDVTIGETKNYEVWYSGFGYFGSQKDIVIDVSAGPDTDHLTLRSGDGGDVLFSAFNGNMVWAKLGDFQFNTTDKVIKINQRIGGGSLCFKQSVDEIVLASPTPEPATIGLMVLGGLLLRRRSA